jgi:hypothetical protein
MAANSSFALPDGFLAEKRHGLGIEIELGPLRARNRPCVLGARDEFLSRMTHLQLRARLLRPAGVLAVQEIVEEAQLLRAAVVGVEMRPVLDAVRLQPFLLGGRTHEAFEIAARMQALAAPIGGGEQRRHHLVPDRRAVAVIFIVERMGPDLPAEIGAVLGQLFFAQRLWPAHQFAVHAAAFAALAGAVLHGLHLHVVPVLPERGENAAVMRHVAVPVGRAFPHAHGGEMRRLQRGDVPLVHAVIGNAV